jgi:hypothetical protein
MCFIFSDLSLIHFALEIGILFVYSHQIYFDLCISFSLTQFTYTLVRIAVSFLGLLIGLEPISSVRI